MTSTSADNKNKLVPELNETKLTLFCRTLGFFLLTFHMSKFLKALAHFDRILWVYQQTCHWRLINGEDLVTNV